MKHNDQLRKCNLDFTCAVNCRQECDVVEREDDEDAMGFGSGDNFAHVTQVLKVTRTDSSQNPPLAFDSSWRLSKIQIILIITAVCLCFLVICMLLVFAIRFAMNERKMASPIKGQCPTSVFYTSGKMVTMNQSHMLNQPSLDFSSTWC
ncbi:uncharacterized protein LOC117103495 isoform X2 [Anneissia japonica]|uniref:uncharacterized protein LOC117103495 isoform X2 n=1 Tax=Anneissia japonica TaxID=1529436 RepID=UPI0014254EF7|nr:uncharacterized protein LOC117103495 isoform X2 [Anneissia japonica]